MPGLDSTLIPMLSKELAIRRVLVDTRKDFIIAPHYRVVFAHTGDELWDELMSNLRSGKHELDLPQIIEVPKASSLTRPGAILNPYDRVLYQALADYMAPSLEAALDRTRVFSHALIDPDPDYRMFGAPADSYNSLRAALQNYCHDGRWSHALRTDVGVYFERLNHHRLKNLLDSSGIASGIVNLLNTSLSIWSDKKSYGIPQGMFPSDLLGNFFLSEIDAHFELAEIPSARYVDDLYLFFPSRREVYRAIAPLCRALRDMGLSLNDAKTKVLPSDQLLEEETELDRMFEAAREEAERIFEEQRAPEGVLIGYDFGAVWFEDLEEDTEEVSPEDIEVEALATLWNQRETQPPHIKDRIDAFCLPKLGLVDSDIALDLVIDGLGKRPHMTRTYCGYLSHFASSSEKAVAGLSQVVEEQPFFYDSELMWAVAALFSAPGLRSATVNRLLQHLQDPNLPPEVRAVCAILVGKHGTGPQRGILRNQYAREQSPYVRSAILFSSRYFPSEERKACKRSWGGHSRINALIAKSLTI